MLRKIGRSGIEVAPLAFGGNVFGWTADEATSFALLDHFVASGMQLIDTADVYSRWAPGHQGGESETIIGKWLKRSGKRDRVVIATKVGMEMAPDKKGLRKDYILRSADDSLRRLQTEYIDLYQSHADDADTPLEETLEAYDTLVKAGKVRLIGASNYGAARLKQALETSRAHGLPQYQTLQPHYNLVERREFEETLAPLCVEEGIGVIPYYSLASGFLTGKYRSQADLGKSVRGQGVKKYLDQRGLAILAALDEVAKETGSTPAQVALAWLMAQPAVTAPIASATSIEQLDDLIGATRLELDAHALDRLDKASRQ
ncbi:aldo/keto reductase [Noviherbaspirillum galbum]|uniref:Aldo/keto reductase n=1 Tax=Noviherbaspirillum galbum TaxID=2709383 RepID=A0A6B3SLJ4_9BURK|nr:aldo/keto reductase [Noviherbaspirillum galbum]NEX59506.1 aldo/keto reductase [Noviherbaspirillum galbum]